MQCVGNLAISPHSWLTINENDYLSWIMIKPKLFASFFALALAQLLVHVLVKNKQVANSWSASKCELSRVHVPVQVTKRTTLEKEEKMYFLFFIYSMCINDSKNDFRLACMLVKDYDKNSPFFSIVCKWSLVLVRLCHLF